MRKTIGAQTEATSTNELMRAPIRWTLMLSLLVFILDMLVIRFKVGVGDFLIFPFVLFNPIFIGSPNFMKDLILRFPSTIIYLFMYVFTFIFFVRKAKVIQTRLAKPLCFLAIVVLTGIYLFQSFVFLLALIGV